MFELGWPNTKGFGIHVHYWHTFKQFKDDMPIFSMVAATLGAVASPIIQTLLPGIGIFVTNALKGLPDMYLPGKDQLEISINPLGTISGNIDRAAGIPVSGVLSGRYCKFSTTWFTCNKFKNIIWFTKYCKICR